MAIRPGSLGLDYLKYGKNFVPQPGSILRTSSVAAWGQLRTDLSTSMDLDMFVGLRAQGRGVYIKSELSAYRLHPGSITVGKTTDDEAELLRRKLQSGFARRSYPVWRPVTRLVDRLLDGLTRKLKFPPIPLVESRPYTVEREHDLRSQKN
jgi:hypothetical protein